MSDIEVTLKSAFVYLERVERWTEVELDGEVQKFAHVCGNFGASGIPELWPHSI